jgi:hypothetical protein
MDIRQFQGSQKYLKCADLAGSPVVVTIQDVVEETVGQGRDTEQKPVLSFTGMEKTLVLNTTNGNTIADALGWETQGWPGRQIELYPTTTDYSGKTVDCIRIRMPVAAAPAAEVPAGEIPF